MVTKPTSSEAELSTKKKVAPVDSISETRVSSESVGRRRRTFLSKYFSARSVFLISRAFRASVLMMPLMCCFESTTGKMVKPDL